MSESSIVMGRIMTYNREDHFHNLRVSQDLPSQQNGYTNFTREMFCTNSLAGKDTWVSGFARSYKNIEHQWKLWIDEFENLIRKLRWQSINVVLETEMFGTHQYMWCSKFYPNGIKVANNYDLIETEEWYFGKGFRNFWGSLELASGFDNLGTEVRTMKSFIDAIDNSLEGKSAIFKIKAADKRRINLLGSSNGVKKFVSDVLKYYVNIIIQNTKLHSHGYKKLPDIVDRDSPVKIKEISISSYNLDTRWIHKFIDDNLE